MKEGDFPSSIPFYLGCPKKLRPIFRVGLPAECNLIKRLSQAFPAASVLLDYKCSQVDNQDQPSYQLGVDWSLQKAERQFNFFSLQIKLVISSVHSGDGMITNTVICNTGILRDTQIA